MAYRNHDGNNDSDAFNPIHAGFVIDRRLAKILEQSERERHNGSDSQEYPLK